NIIFGAVIDESMGDEVRITVIATGFGEHVEAGEKPRPGPREARAAGAGEGRPVKRLGLLAEDELDVPTWQPRRPEPPAAGGGRARARRLRGPRRRHPLPAPGPRGDSLRPASAGAPGPATPAAPARACGWRRDAPADGARVERGPGAGRGAPADARTAPSLRRRAARANRLAS